MYRQLFFSLLLSAIVTGLCAQKNDDYWQQQVDYTISATLHDTTNTLEGNEVIVYHNNSNDTLNFLWIHLWMNAFKNDKTAYSEQKLSAGQNDFYFSNSDQKGYVNRLDFKVNGTSLLIEDHPQYIDVVKVYLPTPLAPGDSIQIATPFHVKIPYRFSRPGYMDQHYSFTQWYPKVAIYDKQGWHEMPYLEWGEYYNDFGNYTVNINVPANYVVAATGMLQNDEQIAWLKAHGAAPKAPPTNKKTKPTSRKEERIISGKTFKTLQYKASMVTDFAWFADKRFVVKYDTLLVNNKKIDVWNFVLPTEEKKWQHSIPYTKNAIHFYSEKLGAYPYPQVSVVCSAMPEYDGMEYPMITVLNVEKEPENELDQIIAHEVGHNWFQAILATNEREHPFMDEGFNTFIEKKYRNHYYNTTTAGKKGRAAKMPADTYELLLDEATSNHTDQPIATASEKFTYDNYNAVAYEKTNRWLKHLEQKIGSAEMNALMHAYFEKWQFKHPSPADFKQLADSVAGKKLDDEFNLLYETGPIDTMPKRAVKFTGLYNFTNTRKYNYIGIAPAVGFNNYDKLMIGLLVHNFNVPANRFRFIATPMFAFGSKKLNGYARVGYTFYPKGKLQAIELYASGAKFSMDDGVGLDYGKVYRGFSKVTPGIHFDFKKRTPLSPISKWMDLKTFIVNEQNLSLEQRPAPADSLYYAKLDGSRTTVIPQLSFGIRNERKLYPWDVQLAVQQVKQIIRSTVTANYFLNYNDRDQGIAVRAFFGKIVYTQTKTDLLRAQNSRYHFTMYGPNGYQDYTYSNAFAERNQSTDVAGRQIMIRDGGFKYRSDYSAVTPGLKTNTIDFFDNWLAAANFTIDIPDKVNPLTVLPFKVPLKVFADVGTSASPWEAESELPKFLYSMGLELPLFKIFKIYYPLVQSKAFKEPNSVNDPTRAGGPTWWQKRLTFSVDITNALQVKAFNFLKY